MKLLDPLLVDGSILDRYLSRLAENTAQVLSRLETCEQRLAAIQKQLDSGKKAPDSSRSSSAARTGRKVPIEANFYNDYLKWKAKVGDIVKKGQVVAVCCMSKNMVVEYGSISAPADGVFIDKSFPDSTNLYGVNIVVGYIENR
ncbi:hypothetical protein [Malikia sp.]|uniref:hypothetical protein n=1 Tax=Malikia sp. TaxID=2070706 RepID=UPI00261BCA69|nr:hypothetical protein [Malikia sp.]MDD2728418.1 hypothetical protein [Malikia sp.]